MNYFISFMPSMQSVYLACILRAPIELAAGPNCIEKQNFKERVSFRLKSWEREFIYKQITHNSGARRMYSSLIIKSSSRKSNVYKNILWPNNNKQTNKNKSKKNNKILWKASLNNNRKQLD